MMRRLLGLFTILAITAVPAAVASASPVLVATPAGMPLSPFVIAHTSSTHLSSSIVTKSVSKKITAPGTYVVVVSLRAHHAQSVTVYLTGQAKRKVRVLKTAAAQLSYNFTLKAKHKKLTARAVSKHPGIHVAMTVRLGSGGGSGGSKNPRNGSTGQTGTTGTTGGSGGGGGGGGGGLLVDPTTGSCTSLCSYTNFVWGDNFDGTGAPNPNTWTPTQGSGCGYSGPATMSQNNADAYLNGSGDLAIVDNQTGANSFESVTLDSAGLVGFRYGSIQARINIPPGQGLCSQFWLYGDQTNSAGYTGPANYLSGPGGNNNGTPSNKWCNFNGNSWPNCGEIDGIETASTSSGPTDGYFDLHGPCPACNGYQQYQNHVNPFGTLAGWHTYGIVWSPGLVEWTIDGKVYSAANAQSLQQGSTWVGDNGTYHILLDMRVGSWLGGPAAGEVFPQQMLVDWVHVYQ